MSGGALLGLVLISMGWFAFIGGLVLGMRFIPGIVGSVTVFFSIPMAAKYGIEVPWPWLWILLPLASDPLRMLFGNRMRGSKDGS